MLDKTVINAINLLKTPGDKIKKRNLFYARVIVRDLFHYTNSMKQVIVS